MRCLSRISLLLFLFIVVSVHCIAQENREKSFYFELNGGFIESFGPSESQAEIIYFDSLAFNQRKHMIAGFAPSRDLELVAGYQTGIIRLQSSVEYFQQDFGLIQQFSTNEYPFALAKMMLARASVKVQASDREKRGFDGFYYGLTLGALTPVSYEMNDQTKAAFYFADFRPSAEFFWSIDFNYSLRTGKKGLYIIAGSSIMMPGLVGNVGKWVMQPNANLTIVRDKVKMYSLSLNLGVGYRLK